MKTKLTPWFPPDIKPVHVGYYETDREEGGKSAFRWWWDGQFWCYELDVHNKAMFQNRTWRGLVENPND